LLQRQADVKQSAETNQNCSIGRSANNLSQITQIDLNHDFKSLISTIIKTGQLATTVED